ncbi:MAG: beta-hydroxyacyl-ACP dehydratase [Planctomycetes bacterium]|nr:beta-hydroxyacyl-ACP dehydratase [Planctomycetota bacterium]
MAAPLDRLIDLLPQKHPFLFVDHVLELEPLRRVAGTVLFPEGHPIFRNHLPGEPLVPGVILIEALAQVAGITLAGAEGAPIAGYLGEVTRLRFHRPVRPGEEILLRAELEQAFGAFARFTVSAEVAGDLAAEGVVVLARRR